MWTLQQAVVVVAGVVADIAADIGADVGQLAWEMADVAWDDVDANLVPLAEMIDRNASDHGTWHLAGMLGQLGRWTRDLSSAVRMWTYCPRQTAKAALLDRIVTRVVQRAEADGLI